MPLLWTGINGGGRLPVPTQKRTLVYPHPALLHAPERKPVQMCILEKPGCGRCPYRTVQPLPIPAHFLPDSSHREAYEAQAEGEGLSPSLTGAFVGNEDIEGGSKGKSQSGPNLGPVLDAGGGKDLPEKGGEWTRVSMASSPLTSTVGSIHWGCWPGVPALSYLPSDRPAEQPGPIAPDVAPGSPRGPPLS